MRRVLRWFSGWLTLPLLVMGATWGVYTFLFTLPWVILGHDSGLMSSWTDFTFVFHLPGLWLKAVLFPNMEEWGVSETTYVVIKSQICGVSLGLLFAVVGAVFRLIGLIAKVSAVDMD